MWDLICMGMLLLIIPAAISVSSCTLFPLALFKLLLHPSGFLLKKQNNKNQSTKQQQEEQNNTQKETNKQTKPELNNIKCTFWFEISPLRLLIALVSDHYEGPRNIGI